MKERNKNASGSATIMVTLALVPMCGLMGLAVDLGWCFFLKKQAQATTDAAALAAAAEAMYELQGNFTGVTCNQFNGGNACTPVQCTGPAANPPTTGPFASGCAYALNYTYSLGGSTQPTVTIQGNVAPNQPPTGTNVITNTVYWVNVVSARIVPQLFSAVLGNLNATVSASSTAAIVTTVVPGQLTALNGPNDCIPTSAYGCGIDLDLTNTTITTVGSVILSSTCNGTSQLGCGATAGATGTNLGSNGPGTVTAQPPYGYIRVPIGQPLTNNTYSTTINFTPTPIVSPGSGYGDPTLNMVQPLLLSNAQVCPVLGGGIPNPSPPLGPCVYYAADGQGNPLYTPTGLPPITVSGNVTFSSPNPGSYYFYGGLQLLPGSTTTFGPGQYVIVGTSGSTALTLGGTVTGDSTTGTMFILTAPDYPGLNIPPPLLGSPLVTSLTLGATLVLPGASVSLTGLSSTALPPQDSGILFWQDRMNNNGSSAGFYVGQSGTGATLTLNGVLYQPEGAYIDSQASTITGGLQIITGGLQDSGSTFNVTQVNNPILRYVVALIQ